jgi:hypothetical protein
VVATSTFNCLPTASVLAIRSLMRAQAVLLETSMQAALGQPHIRHQIIDHKRIDAWDAGRLGARSATAMPAVGAIEGVSYQQP